LRLNEKEDLKVVLGKVKGKKKLQLKMMTLLRWRSQKRWQLLAGHERKGEREEGDSWVFQ